MSVVECGRALVENFQYALVRGLVDLLRDCRQRLDAKIQALEARRAPPPPPRPRRRRRRQERR